MPFVVAVRFGLDADDFAPKEDIEDQFSRCNVITKENKGFGPEELKSFFDHKWVVPYILVAVTKKDLEQINQCAEQYKKNKEVLVMWVGEGQKQEDNIVPMFTQNQLKDCPSPVNWDGLCRLAAQPEQV